MSTINSKKINFLNKRKNFFKKSGQCCVFYANILLLLYMCEGQNTKIKERGYSMSSLSSKERLFCTYYCISRNGREAATKSGYMFPEKNAVRLLEKKEVAEEIEKIDREKRAKSSDVISGYYRLAFGCFADAISLLFKEDITAEELQKMDLYNISDIRRKKGGDIEIKFFDRIKALEHLEEISSGEEKSTAHSLLDAIEKGAAALRDDYSE